MIGLFIAIVMIVSAVFYAFTISRLDIIRISQARRVMDLRRTR